ncbi:hypothetical protein CKQ84_17680 [Shewanella sp. WE21]|nr:hypothetical protein CKQ84_17680 [Shewanella sp. WE21]
MLIGVCRGGQAKQHPKNIESRLARQKTHPLAGRAQILSQNQFEASAPIPKQPEDAGFSGNLTHFRQGGYLQT